MFTDIQQYAALQEVNEGYYFEQGAGILMGPREGSVAVWKPLPENNTQPLINPRSLILHTNAGNSPAKWWQLWGWWNNASVTGEAHWQIDNDGIMAQAMSIYRRADCNFSANRWFHSADQKYYGAISIETADNGAASVEATPWNWPQVQGIVRVGTALQCQYGTGCNEVLTWDGKGIDYHTKFPYQGVGRPAWTNAYGKTCPGKARKAQVSGIRQLVFDKVVAYIQSCQRRGVAHGIPGL